ncbi:GGDEF domain-containing protein [soil metagenome]
MATDRDETHHTDVFATGEVAEAVGRGRPVLVIFDQNNLHNWHMIVRKETRIGRDVEAELEIDDDTVSRIHARIMFDNIDRPSEEPYCILVDNGSRNGTFLNGKRVGQPERLRGGDRVFIGNSCLVYQVRSEMEINSDQKLRALATTDALTGLMNRGYMAIQFQKEFERAVRYKRPVSVMMLDLDFFKKINDTYGHATGDVVLKSIADQVLARIRVHDVAGRYGGEEFAIMLPETGLQGTTVLADRMRRGIEHTEIIAGDAKLHVTTSIGVAEARLDGTESMEQFVARGDKALLEAKANGKNRVEVAE